jgi:hypothetical protein
MCTLPGLQDTYNTRCRRQAKKIIRDLHHIMLKVQVEEDKLLRMTLDGQLSWASHIDKVVVKMGRGMSVRKGCSVFLSQKPNVLVVRALVLSHLD